MIAVLTSGVALGVHVPGLLLRQRLAEHGVPAAVYVLEAYWEQADRDRLARSREVFQRDFRIALATQRLRRRHDELVPAEARQRVFAAWQAAGVTRFVVLSGFWLPVVEAYVRETGREVAVDTCHLDSVDSPSFAPYDRRASGHRAVRLMDHAAGRLPWTIPVTSRPPVPWAQRGDRVLVHGGGWSLGTYRQAAGRLRAAGHRVDLVLGGADAAPPGGVGPDTGPVAGAGPQVRCFRIDPRWNAWDDAGFPPLCRVGSGAADGRDGARWLSGDGLTHPSFTLTREARATVSKPGGGSLLDGLWAATPSVLLEPFGAHEERNAELWLRLGLGVRLETWQDSGHSTELLHDLHRRALWMRDRIPDYARSLASGPPVP
ncbi:hypothetical protein ACIQM4_04575 [Streptomyces sp. NPDC091272]|uniref:hypothetical protein n=1 Tax=Streptomyces sp. NPDC091272 TaxID=3365981 RepID=UPI0037FDF3AA